MQEIIFINPLLPGKLNEYKAVLDQLSGERKEEYLDFLKRYGLKNSKVFYHKLNSTEFSVVKHDLEDYSQERLPGWPTSKHPFDLWFKEQLGKLHDYELAKASGLPMLLLDINAAG